MWGCEVKDSLTLGAGVVAATATSTTCMSTGQTTAATMATAAAAKETTARLHSKK